MEVRQVKIRQVETVREEVGQMWEVEVWQVEAVWQVRVRQMMRQMEAVPYMRGRQMEVVRQMQMARRDCSPPPKEGFLMLGGVHQVAQLRRVLRSTAPHARPKSSRRQMSRIGEQRIGCMREELS